jgi:threonine aldolase
MNNNIVDLRSDTVTYPTEEMRSAMASAHVGDDVYNEDPTVNKLQEVAAEMMGKEAGLFVPSGTMGNLLAILSHCNRGDEAIMGDLGHTFLFEGGGVASLGGIMPHVLPNQPDGTIKIDDIFRAIRPDDVHHPTSKLIILENTHNRAGGVVLTPDYTKEVSDIAHKHQLSLHLDGARIFNASAALNVQVKQLTTPADSVSFCLSKALCAPVGSVLCGSNNFIHQAKRWRKALGGGMRQVGILAAAGLVALETMVSRLGDDHQKARALAEGLMDIQGIIVENPNPQTNMVFIRLDETLPFSADDLRTNLGRSGVLIGIVGKRRLRLVTHYWISDSSVERTVSAFRTTVK